MMKSISVAIFHNFFNKSISSAVRMSIIYMYVTKKASSSMKVQ